MINKNQVLILCFTVGLLTMSCVVTPPDPIIIDESFETSSIPSEIWTWESASQYSPEIFDDNGNYVLKLTSSATLIGSGPDSNHPHYSGFGINSGPNERPLQTSWEYEASMKLKVVDYTEGWSSLTFRYYGDSFDDHSALGIFSGLNTSLYSYPKSESIDLQNTLTANTWYTIKIVSSSNNYSVYIDDIKLYEETDSPSPLSNVVWEVAGGMTLYFDDISVIRTDIE